MAELAIALRPLAAIAAEARARGEAGRMAELATEQHNVLAALWRIDRGCDFATDRLIADMEKVGRLLSRWLPAAPAPKEETNE